MYSSQRFVVANVLAWILNNGKKIIAPAIPKRIQSMIKATSRSQNPAYATGWLGTRVCQTFCAGCCSTGWGWSGGGAAGDG